MSLDGRLIRQVDGNNLQGELEVADLLPGVYYLMIQLEDEWIPRKIIKT